MLRRRDGSALPLLSASGARLLGAVAALGALTALFFNPLLRGETYQDVASRENEVYPWAGLQRPYPHTLHYDQPDQFYPYQVFVNRALRAGELPLWNPDSFAGQPFYASNSYAIAYPPRVPLALLLPPTRVHDALTVLHVLGSGVAMYLLLSAAALSFPAALFGAMVWAVNSFTLAWLPFEGFPALGVWLPLALLLLQRALAQRSWRATVGLAAVLSLLFSTGFLLCLLTVVILAAYAGVVLLRRWWRPPGKSARVMASAALSDVLLFLPLALVAGLTAVQLLPTLEVVRSVERAALPYAEYVKLSLPAQHLLYFFISPPFSFASSHAEGGVVHDALLGNLLYDLLQLPPIGDPYHSMLFLGTPTALLALVGCLARGPLPNLARWLAAVVLALAIGTPVAWLAYHFVPGASVLKPLGRFLIFFNFAVAMLAAFGLDLLLRWRARTRPDVAAPVVPPLRYGVAALLALAALVQLYHVGDRVTRHHPDDPTLLQPAAPLVRALRVDGAARLLPVSVDDALVPFPHDRTFYGAAALSVGLSSASGYEILLPARIANLWRVAAEGVAPATAMSEPRYWSYAPAWSAAGVRWDLLPRLAITHVVTPPDIDRDPAWATAPGRGAGLEPLYDGLDGRAYRLAAPLPRAYVVADCEQVEGPAAALARFADASFDPTRAVIVEAAHTPRDLPACGGPSHPPSPGTGAAEIVARGLNTLTVRVDALADGWLVIAESWDAGWQATVDGHGAEVVPGNYAFRTLRVPAGAHTVELRYQPLSFVAGAIITGLTLLLVAAILGQWAASRRRPRRIGSAAPPAASARALE